MINSDLGRVLIGVGLLIVVVGVVVVIADRLGLPLGRLPGDITFQRGPLTVFAPLVSCLVVSVLLTVIVNVVLWLLRRSP